MGDGLEGEPTAEDADGGEGSGAEEGEGGGFGGDGGGCGRGGAGGGFGEGDGVAAACGDDGDLEQGGGGEEGVRHVDGSVVLAADVVAAKVGSVVEGGNGAGRSVTGEERRGAVWLEDVAFEVVVAICFLHVEVAGAVVILEEDVDGIRDGIDRGGDVEGVTVAGGDGGGVEGEGDGVGRVGGGVGSGDGEVSGVGVGGWNKGDGGEEGGDVEVWAHGGTFRGLLVK